MKIFRLLAAVVFITAFSVISAFAQANTLSGKIAVIDTQAFSETGGIIKYANAKAALMKEFESVNAELQTLGTRYGNLEKEIQNLRNQASKPGSTISPATIQAKIEEYDNLGRQIQYKQEDAKARSVSRYNVVISPVVQDINKAIQEYAKQKGYTLILNASKLNETGLVLGIGDPKIDVTKEFIAFYNARPAGSATTGAPK